ncbi:MAG: aminotransferase class V-fold PLP-dependent enzyme [Dehalococcoidales bacterium]|nr:aminotransferase class V-fold PLP-dependent enzyme [Dehalococcoidales bacterium]
MNVKLLEESALRHYEFPITDQKVFLAHAAASPLPRRVSSAMMQYLAVASAEGQWEYLYADIEEETRRYAARLIGAQEEEIAFVSSTSMGLSMVASSISWRKGDNVVIADGDFPSNIYPWLNLQSRGVTVKFIPRHHDGAVTLDDVMNQVDDNTRLVSLSSVNYITGYKIDIPAIGQYLHENGILFCVDAIQSLGAIPIDTIYVDFLAAGAHKWLLGPQGIGILYVKRCNIEKLTPVLAGWKCVQSSKKYLNYDFCLLDSAKCLEPGGINITGIVGLHAALGLLLETGIDEIAGRLAGFRKIMKPALREKGYDLIGPSDDELSSGITSFSSQTLGITNLRQKLDNNGFVVSLRDSLDGRKCIRISPHFYNSADEIALFLAELPYC